ncbi:uncharacterized protein KY384_008173 [Bacidia gigantensis]|uniref:uncharacterized protein n=1 Tax=Bacidia gigantensis TaxID=2732470 RepID=UPI001D056EEB|nr:uncharacterized protein KY384_008173 [Bacidia gigantensis]KAG8526744.1 hypothetical protein KY384_008173 [Bacidia gigantensis]
MSRPVYSLGKLLELGDTAKGSQVKGCWKPPAALACFLAVVHPDDIDAPQKYCDIAYSSWESAKSTDRRAPAPFEAARIFGPISCMISISGKTAFGSLFEANSISPMLTINPGVGTSPHVALDIKARAGTKDLYSNIWRVNDTLNNTWALTYLTIYGGTAAMRDEKVTPFEVRAQLPNETYFEDLVCMEFTSWAQVIDRGTAHNSSVLKQGQSESTREALDVLFEPRRPYRIKVWFLSPTDFESLRSKVIIFLEKSLAGMVLPLLCFQDSKFEYFLDYLNRIQRPADRRFGGLHRKHDEWNDPAERRVRRLYMSAASGDQRQQDHNLKP